MHALCGQTERALALLARGAVVGAKDGDGNTPLHLACRHQGVQATEMAMALVDRGADIEARDGAGNTPLHLAVHLRHRSTEMALALLDRGADIEAKDGAGKTPLYLACHQNPRERSTDTVLALLDRGADILFTGNIGSTSSEVLALLLDRGMKIEQFIDAKDTEKVSTFFFGAEMGAAYQTVALALLDAGADIETKEPHMGWTILMRAFKGGDFRFAQAILDRGADVDAKDCSGKDALFYAVEHAIQTRKIDGQEVLRAFSESRRRSSSSSSDTACCDVTPAGGEEEVKHN